DVQYRRKALRDRRELQDVVGLAPQAALARGAQRDQPRSARPSFLDIRRYFFEHVRLRGDRDHRGLSVDQGQRSVLHLAGREALGMDVSDFLELQGAFQGGRVVDVPADVEESLGPEEYRGDLA